MRFFLMLPPNTFLSTTATNLNPNNILEGNEDATEKYIKYLDSLWNSYRSGKIVIIHNEDASEQAASLPPALQEFPPPP